MKERKKGEGKRETGEKERTEKSSKYKATFHTGFSDLK